MIERTDVATLQPCEVHPELGRRYSLWVMNFGLACCGIELIAAAMARHDLTRFAVIPFAHGPASRSVVVAGTVTDKMAPVMKRVYDQMPEPKYVISFGSCANCGGPYWDSYSVTTGVDQIIPIDVFVPGCPPRPEALLDGIIMLQPKIAREDISEKWGSTRARLSGDAACRFARGGGGVDICLMNREGAASRHPSRVEKRPLTWGVPFVVPTGLFPCLQLESVPGRPVSTPAKCVNLAADLPA